MSLGLLGVKLGMTQVYNDDGEISPVTVLQLGPCPVLQIRTQERDGYDAVQIGYRDKKRKNATRAERGHVSADMASKRRSTPGAKPLLEKAECEPKRFIREFRYEEAVSGVEVGQVLGVEDVFTDITAVDVIANSKGRGTAGVIKRHGFKGMPASHGAKKVHRQAGSTASLGSTGGGGRPKKGLRREGRYGATRVSARNLKVVSFNAEDQILLVKGAVPGFNGTYVMVRPTNKKG